MDPEPGGHGAADRHRSGRSHPRDAGRRCRCRRYGCRTGGPGSAWPSRSIRGAEPGKPSPQRGVGHFRRRPGPAAFQSAKSHGIPLVRFHVAAMAGAQVREAVAGQPTVRREGRDGVVDVALERGIGQPGILQRLRQAEHLGDVLGGPREDMGRQDVDRRLVGMERRLVRGGDLLRCLRLQSGLDEHRILASIEFLIAQVPDIRHVLDVQDLESVVEQDAPDQVGQQEAAEVADVGVPIDRRAAGVDPDSPGFEGLDRPDSAGQRVAEVEHQRAALGSAHPTGERSDGSNGPSSLGLRAVLEARLYTPRDAPPGRLSRPVRPPCVLRFPERRDDRPSGQDPRGHPDIARPGRPGRRRAVPRSAPSCSSR